jgi:hypothetical protein
MAAGSWISSALVRFDLPGSSANGLCRDRASSNITPLRITISIEYPISNCPAKLGAASFSRLDPKRPGPWLVLLLDASPPGRFR